MEDNNLPSLNVDTNSPLPQGVAGGVGNHLLLRLSPQPLLPHINAHALIHTLHTSYLPLPLPPPHDQPYFCALMNSLSIKNSGQNQVSLTSIFSKIPYVAALFRSGINHGAIKAPGMIAIYPTKADLGNRQACFSCAELRHFRSGRSRPLLQTDASCTISAYMQRIRPCKLVLYCGFHQIFGKRACFTSRLRNHLLH